MLQCEAGSARQAEGEGGAVARRAFASQFTVHRQHELLDDAQAQAGGRLASRGPRRKAAIAAEHPGLIVLAEPGPFILNLAFDVPGARRAHRDANLLAGRRKLDGVGQEIIQHLVEGGGIGLHEHAVARRENDLEARVACASPPPDVAGPRGRPRPRG